METPRPGNPSAAVPVATATKPAWRVTPRPATESIRLELQHPEFGTLAWDLPPDQAQLLSEDLLSALMVTLPVEPLRCDA